MLTVKHAITLGFLVGAANCVPMKDIFCPTGTACHGINDPPIRPVKRVAPSSSSSSLLTNSAILAATSPPVDTNYPTIANSFNPENLISNSTNGIITYSSDPKVCTTPLNPITINISTDKYTLTYYLGLDEMDAQPTDDQVALASNVKTAGTGSTYHSAKDLYPYGLGIPMFDTRALGDNSPTPEIRDGSLGIDGSSDNLVQMFLYHSCPGYENNICNMNATGPYLYDSALFDATVFRSYNSEILRTIDISCSASLPVNFYALKDLKYVNADVPNTGNDVVRCRNFIFQTKTASLVDFSRKM